MPRCLFLTPFPIAVPKHGGQVRAASMLQAAQLAGWTTASIGIYPAAFFALKERGAYDLALESPGLHAQAQADVVFVDLHAARAAARDVNVVARLRSEIERIDPDVIEIEHPWAWLVLQEALPPGRTIPIVYSSYNIEWVARLPLFRLGMKTRDSDALIEDTRRLETELARTADLVFSISDREAEEIERASGRPAVYLPPASDLASGGAAPRADTRFARERTRRHCEYAALIGSAYWPNVEGFFGLFPEGLGFLAHDEQIWVAGGLGEAIRRDRRYRDFFSLNETRFRSFGFVESGEKPGFFTAATCAIVPVQIGAGAKLKTADALASGRPVIATSHALEGYGPVIAPVIGDGVYIANSPQEFRALVRRAMREGLPGCPGSVRSALSLTVLAAKWHENVGKLLSKDTAWPRTAPETETGVRSSSP